MSETWCRAVAFFPLVIIKFVMNDRSGSSTGGISYIPTGLVSETGAESSDSAGGEAVFAEASFTGLGDADGCGDACRRFERTCADDDVSSLPSSYSLCTCSGSRSKVHQYLLFATLSKSCVTWRMIVQYSSISSMFPQSISHLLVCDVQQVWDDFALVCWNPDILERDLAS